ncbi:uncharacterized protein [Drosophila kikkawai]|uniref:Uncharacterized protein isoform X3 n=1 Tax=Drosophila kikkawai TaxID=30033 RepID=A0A6P4I9B6_DROKI|nr:uncharacterized protein LOC108076927 isoform X3 [Drosophila kikkawai]
MAGRRASAICCTHPHLVIGGGARIRIRIRTRTRFRIRAQEKEKNEKQKEGRWRSLGYTILFLPNAY